MDLLQEEEISCPYCGEPLDVLIDPQDVGQEYIEDCQVCCRPINFMITEDEMGEMRVTVRADDEM
ncbi:CPXCG motif-containing cysteine-rich protein [Leucothrix pacifica]|uniref:CPXCG motif-containing cysteine-rich protein n=1 Tax=Leucothrix pacifica TaxID=1247513 RepID=A0A317CDT3_9GAMM|nr:CPXCG motif-containing cysteine-rich protein [Leucothrix pacifica]PWQ95493.1 CPXCG motif-containing cysteine-rich protein [Leucothrix pacifica]